MVITPGAKPILFFSILALVNPGDEVLYPNPGFPIYESVIRFVGARPVPMPLVESREFSIDIDRVMGSINDRTKMIILNSPNNPTGGVMGRDDLRAIAEAAGRHNSWVLADEVYGEFIFEGRHESIAQFDGMKERTILLDGHSKTFAMTGWRLGYAGMPAPLAQKIAQLVTNSVSCTATFIQDAGVAALTGDWESVRSMILEFKARRDLAWEALNETPGIACVKPRGAFYAWPNVTEACRILGVKSSEEFQDVMISEGGVAVLSRTCFGPRNEGEADEYVRISFATSRDLLAEGIRRMRSLIERYL
jgi:aspartate/methionine/tyrosine aminotransferase